MTGIIDVHAHLGDLLYPNGGALIEKKGIKQRSNDLLGVFEYLDTLPEQFTETMFKFIPGFVWGQINRRVDQDNINRNFTATRENLRRELDKYGIDYCVLLAVYPNVTFDDLHAASEKDRSLIPFTGADFTNLAGIEEKFRKDVTAGAKGMKLHPILQKTKMDAPETMQVVEAFAPYDLPILLHTGYANYYLTAAEAHLQNTDYGEIDHLVPLIKAFPNVKFIAGHAGLDSVNKVITLLQDFPNVWVDVSFQKARVIKELIGAFGPEKVMYGSDWPWGSIGTSITKVEQACDGDSGLRQRLFHDNAAELLKL